MSCWLGGQWIWPLINCEVWLDAQTGQRREEESLTQIQRPTIAASLCCPLHIATKRDRGLWLGAALWRWIEFPFRSTTTPCWVESMCPFWALVWPAGCSGANKHSRSTGLKTEPLSHVCRALIDPATNCYLRWSEVQQTDNVHKIQVRSE